MTRAIVAMALVALIAIAGPAVTAAHADDSYTVQDGDTLVAIAAKAGVPSSQMLDWASSIVTLNGLPDADSITPGQVLKLPPTSTSTTATVSQTTTPAPKPTPGASYTVQAGDTLLGIAAGQGVAAGQQMDWVAAVRTLNAMTDDGLHVGQKLTLPAQPASVAVTGTTLSATSSASGPSAPASSPAPLVGTTSATGVTSGYNGTATSYADMFVGRNMGCTGSGVYNHADTSIIAVGPAMYDQFPCGTVLEVCGLRGCIQGIRKDACPGCAGYSVDLSRAGLTAVCGPSSCAVRVRRP